MLFSPEIRRVKIRNSFLFLFVNLVLIWYIIFIFIIFRDQLKNECVQNYLLWLSVYACITFLHLVRCFTAIFIWKNAKDPGTMIQRMEIFFGAWIFLSEVIWTFYGNFIVYSDTLNKSCEHVPSGHIFTVQTLWVSCLVIIIYGYFLMLMLCGSCCFFITVIYVKNSWA